MAFNADLLYQKYAGQSVSYDGITVNIGQCAQWIEYVLTDRQYGYGLAPFWGNAIDFWNNYGGSLTAFDKVTDGSIKKGDIVIFNSLVGSIYGHIDMAMNDGSYAQFSGADSNWSGNKTVHLVNHVGSQYIQGVLRLKGSTMQPATYEQAQQLSQTTLLRKVPMSFDEWNKYHAAANRTYQQLNQDWAASDEAKQARFKCWDYDRLLSTGAVAVTKQTVINYINAHLG